MVFHQPQKRFTVPVIKIDAVPVECVNKFNFLGIMIDQQSCCDGVEYAYSVPLLLRCILANIIHSSMVTFSHICHIYNDNNLQKITVCLSVHFGSYYTPTFFFGSGTITCMWKWKWKWKLEAGKKDSHRSWIIFFDCSLWNGSWIY